MATQATIGIDSYRRLLDGHMGRNTYRDIVIGDSWMATCIVLDIDTYRRLLDGHMGRIRYRYIQETLVGWPHGPH